MYLIDEEEKFWLLRSFVAKMQLWFNSDKFLVVQLTHNDSNNTLKKRLYFCNYMVFCVDAIQLSYKNEDANLQYFTAQFVSWYSNKLGIHLQYSEFCSYYFEEQYINKYNY